MRRIRRTFVLTFAIALPCLAAQPLTAQQWTPEEQELLDQLDVCWAAWWEAVAQQDFDVWARACPHDDQLVGWWIGSAVPGQGVGWMQHNFKALADIRHRTAPSLREVRPVLVRIRGDAAFVLSYLSWTRLGKDGEPDEHEFKRGDWFYRKDGKWLLAVVMDAPK